MLDPPESRLGHHIVKYVKERWQIETGNECKFSLPVLPMLARQKQCVYMCIMSIDSAFYVIQQGSFETVLHCSASDSSQ